MVLGLRPTDRASQRSSAPLPGLALRLLSDERLARLTAKGDRAAFGVVFDRYHRELYRYCMSLLRDPHDAADALQSTMIRAMNALEGETRAIALRPWLYRIAHNESLSLIRRRTIAEQDGGGGELAALQDVERSAEARAATAELLEDIRSLPERQRGALVMRELAGLGYDEIAAALDSTPAAVKQAIYEARRALFELAKGRELECDGVRRRLSDGDGRTARSRVLRAHLRVCADCREFQAVTVERRSSLAALVPAMPSATAAVLRGLVADGGSSSASGVGTLAGVGAPLGAKSIASLVAAVAVGAGTAGVVDAPRERPGPGIAAAVPAPGGKQHSPAERVRPAQDPGTARKRRAERSGGNPATARGERTREPRPRESGARSGPAPSAPQPQAAPSSPRAAAPAPATQQPSGSGPAEPGAVPVVDAPVVEETVAVVTQETASVQETVGSTVTQVQEELPVQTPQLLP